MTEAARKETKGGLIDLPQQQQAADPRSLVWVAANAGSGKTHVLANRVVRLLLEGSDPAQILCLTYTKAAATEMKTRVFALLGRWTRMEDAELRTTLTRLTGHDVSDLGRARQLFARALETPGGLKVQTIHAFCETILRRFALEANIAGRFEVMDDAQRSLFTRRARRTVLERVAGDPDAPEGIAIRALLDDFGDQGFDSIIDEAFADPSRFLEAIEALGPRDTRRARIQTAIGLPGDWTMEDLAQSCWPLGPFDNAVLAQLESAVDPRPNKDKIIKGRILALRHARAQSDPEARINGVLRFVLKATFEPFDPHVTKGVEKAFPGVGDLLKEAAELAVAKYAEWRLLVIAERTFQALNMLDDMLTVFERLKREGGLLDFSDMIERTFRLLSRPDIGPWVRYKLDAGIDHILIDEGQDTSPRQWDVIRRLTDEMFSGETAHPRARTLFAVGDDKQSIYSFMGAEPDQFVLERKFYRDSAKRIGRAMEEIDFKFSFRSSPDVLALVDDVFSHPDAMTGVYRDGDRPDHEAIKAKLPGRVELWPMVAGETRPPLEDWTAIADPSASSPVRLARAIADTIGDWVASGFATAGDILVLVRKRSIFNRALVRELKMRNIGVGGLDRLNLVDHIAIKDLMALTRFVLQPGDELSLAALLKSPIFGFDDDALERLALARLEAQTSLWTTLQDVPEHETVVAELSRWRGLAETVPAFEFYAHVLGVDGARRKLTARLGGETSDMIDEFLNLAIEHGKPGEAGLQSFLHALETGAPEIKRELDASRDEVRIMTVHGAKGLEATHVFLVDDGGKPYQGAREPYFLDVRPDMALKSRIERLPILTRGETPAGNGPVQRVLSERRQRAADEYRRLLYVGLTRARATLVMCGYRTGADQDMPEDRTRLLWHHLVSQVFPTRACLELGADHPAQAHLDGPILRRLSIVDQPDEAEEENTGLAPVETVASIAFAPLPNDPTLPKPLNPSGATAIIEADPIESDAPRTTSPVLSGPLPPNLAIARGNAVHRLLQVLPDCAVGERAERAAQWLAQTLSDWSATDRMALAAEVMAVLEDPAHDGFFSASGRAEVSISGEIALGERRYTLSGQIDRLVVTDDRVLILDYKTNRPAPERLDAVPEGHVAQLALYRALTANIYPDHIVEAALIYTAGPVLHRLSPSQLEDALDRLTRALDAPLTQR